MRWHFSVVLNELLDRTIININKDFSNRKNDYAQSLLINRKLFSAFLSDPLTYLFGGTLIFDLIKSAKDDFQLDYLKEMINIKFKTIDNLVTDYLRNMIGDGRYK
jgi:hypothetical protein